MNKDNKNDIIRKNDMIILPGLFFMKFICVNDTRTVTDMYTLRNDNKNIV